MLVLRRNTGFLLAAFALLLAAPAIASGSAAAPVSAWERLFLRAHPLLVHFPIALLLAAVPLELLHAIRSSFVRRFRAYRPRPTLISHAALACVAMGALAAWLSVWSGWENAEHEPHGRSVAQLIELHRWLGVATLTLASLAFFAGIWIRFVEGPPRTLLGIYRTLVIAGALVVGAAGHFGGSIVRGEGYLLDPLREAILGPAETAKPADAASPAETDQTAGVGESLVRAEPDAESAASGDRLMQARATFERDILPIFEARCVECHGRTHAYGESRLRLHSFDAVRAHIGTTMIIPGFASSSEVYRRVALPADDWDIMPADGDPLTPEQIAAIGAWIESLAPGDLAEPARGAQQGRASPDAAAPPSTESPSIDSGTIDSGRIDGAIARLRSLGAHADRIALDADLVRVSFAPVASRCTDETLEALTGLEPVLAELDLSASLISDAGGASLARFPSLHTLTLSRTSIGPRTILALADLPSLRSLTLASTPIGAECAAGLARLDSLHALYLWNTRLSPADIASLRERLPGVRIDAGEIALPDAPPPPADEGSQATNAG